MGKTSLLLMAAVLALAAAAGDEFERDLVETSGGELEITFIGHGTLMFRLGGRVIHVDPWSRLADYGRMPKADLVLITHHHMDHLDSKALEAVSTDSTITVYTESCTGKGIEGIVMKNGDEKTFHGFEIEAVPAYNIAHGRENGRPWHPKGEGNGYIVEFGDRRVYIAGDTENVPEMKSLEDIDIAFLPMNIPYTMTPEMLADAAKSFKPAVLYPYHFGDTETSELVDLLKKEERIKVHIRAGMK